MAEKIETRMQSLGGGYSHDCAKAIALVPFFKAAY